MEDAQLRSRMVATAQLCEALAKESNVETETAKAILSALPRVVGDLLRGTSAVRIQGLCTFIRKDKPPRAAGTKVICGREVALKPKAASVTVRAAVHQGVKSSLQ